MAVRNGLQGLTGKERGVTRIFNRSRFRRFSGDKNNNGNYNGGNYNDGGNYNNGDNYNNDGNYNNGN